MIILASGPSVKKYPLRDLEKKGTLVALNGAALYVKPDIAITMDRLVAEYCVPMWITQNVPRILLRKGITQNFTPEQMDRCGFFTHDGDNPTYMTPVSGCLNGSNSGTCALNLAYQFAPKRVFLLGFDMQRGEKPASVPYWHPPYPWNTAGAAKNGKLAEWAHEFEAIKKQFDAKGIEVFNVNHRSVIEAFPQISFVKFWQMV